MPGLRGSGRLGTRRAAVAVTLGLYALLLTVGPFGHHDLACHLKSPTHCTTCVFTSTPGPQPGNGVQLTTLPATTPLGGDVAARSTAGEHWTQTDRAPPPR